MSRIREVAEQLARNYPPLPLDMPFQTIPSVDVPALADAIETALLAEREAFRREVVIFLRNHARFAGFTEMFGGYSAKEALEMKATQIEIDAMGLCFGQTYEESEAVDLKIKAEIAAATAIREEGA